MKTLSQISIQDLHTYPVWEYVSETDTGEPLLEHVERVPVHELSNRVIATQVQLQNGERRWAILGNIQLRDKRSTDQFLTVSIEHGGRWFDLARYHDSDYSQRGPQQLADFLNLSINEVFPIKYDLAEIVIGLPTVVSGIISAEPPEKLTAGELLQLALGQ
jgi:hypothetical protein